MRRIPGYSLRASCVGARVQPAPSDQRIPVGPLWLVDVARVLLSGSGFARSLRGGRARGSNKAGTLWGPGGYLSSASPISARVFSFLIQNGSLLVGYPTAS